MSPQKIRVLLADDHTLVRRGIAQLINMEDDLEVVGEAEDGMEACALARDLKPDLVLLDLAMPRCSGLEALPRILDRSPRSVVVVLTYSAEEADVATALQLGAHGYLLKNLDPDSLCNYIRAAVKGEDAPISRQVTRTLLTLARDRLNGLEPAGDPPGPTLTSRERDIVALIATGATNREIGQRLFLSEHTIKNHVKRILEKLEVQNRAQVAAWATQVGLVPPGEG